MKKSTLNKVLILIKPYRWLVLASLLLAMASAAAALAVPVLCGKAIDAMMGRGAVDFNALLSAIIGIVLVVLPGAAVQQLLALCNNKITFSVCRDMRRKVNSKINRLPLSYIDANPTGDTVSRMVADVDSFADGLLMGFTQLFTGVVTIITTLAIMFYLNVIIAAVVVVLTPMSIFVAKFIARRINKFFKEQAKVRGEQTAFVNEIIEGQKTVRAFAHEDDSLAEFDVLNTKLEKAAMNATFFSSLTNPSTRLVNNIVYAVVAFISVVYAVNGGITVGQLSVFLSYASQYAKPFNEISGVITELQNAFACAERIFELLNEENEPDDTKDPLNPESVGAVEIDNVSFGYTPDKSVISDFSLKAEPGQRIAIVGPTGCGKTTLINLLMRFYDTDRGCIKLDGVDIRCMTRKNLRKRYGMVLQDTWLAPGTIRENIAYARPDASEEEITEAAKAAHAHSFIRRLPKGYDTVIGENGGSLSAGQKQLLCIARAMLALPTVLILDEATSSVDTRTEQKIQSAFARLMKGKTSFIVAHRLSTVKEADVILVMNDGRIIERGRHDELLRKNGFYARLYNSQLK